MEARRKTKSKEPSTSPMKQTTLKLRASEAHRWTKCPASPHLILANQDKIVKDSSTYADEGSLAHELAAEALVLGYDESAFPNEEMAEHVLNYVTYVLSHVKPGGKLYVENRFSVHYDENQKCAVDALIVNPGELVVIDLKYGAGISVAIEDNEQLLIYGNAALAFLSKTVESLQTVFKRTPVKLAIYQPRVRGEEAEREWTLTVGELLKHGDRLTSSTQFIKEDPKAAKTYSPSDSTCQWCDAKAFCGAYAKMLLDGVPNGKKIFDKRAPAWSDAETLDDAKLVLVMERLPGLVKWGNSIKDYLERRLKEGHAIPGVKLVRSSPHRKWKDEKKAEKYLTTHLEPDTVRVSELISPAQAEKELKRKKINKWTEQLEKLVERPEGGPTIALASDSRAEWQPVKAEDEFDALD